MNRAKEHLFNLGQRGSKYIKKCVKITVWPFFICCFPRLAVKIFYRMIFGKFPDLRSPSDINEKMQFLKVGYYYNNPMVTDCVDKYRVKELLADHFDAEKLGLKWARLYAAFDTVEDLFASGFQDYPPKFVIKCNHGGGYNYICTDKSKLNVPELRKILTSWMKEDYWKRHVEYQYRFIKKKIFVEEFFEDIDDTFKIYCFGGKPQFLYVSNPDSSGNPDVYLDFFDINFSRLPISLADHLHSLEKIEKPACFEKMLQIASSLSREFPFVRVDMHCSGEKILFSELTFLPTGGYMKLLPAGTAEKWGKLLELEKFGFLFPLKKFQEGK